MRFLYKSIFCLLELNIFTEPEPKIVTPQPAPKPTPTKEAAKPIQKEAPKVAATTAAPALPTEVVELEKAIEVAASLAVKEYNKAIQVLNA